MNHVADFSSDIYITIEDSIWTSERAGRMLDSAPPPPPPSTPYKVVLTCSTALGKQSALPRRPPSRIALSMIRHFFCVCRDHGCGIENAIQALTKVDLKRFRKRESAK